MKRVSTRHLGVAVRRETGLLNCTPTANQWVQKDCLSKTIRPGLRADLAVDDELSVAFEQQWLVGNE